MASQHNMSCNGETLLSRTRMIASFSLSPQHSNCDPSSSNTVVKSGDQYECQNEDTVASHFEGADMSLKNQMASECCGRAQCLQFRHCDINYESTDKKPNDGSFDNVNCITENGIICKTDDAVSTCKSCNNAKCSVSIGEIRKNTEEDFNHQSIDLGSNELDTKKPVKQHGFTQATRENYESASRRIFDPSLTKQASSLRSSEADKKNETILTDLKLSDVPSCSGTSPLDDFDGRCHLEEISIVDFWDDWKQLFDSQDSVKHEATVLTTTNLTQEDVKEIQFKTPFYDYLRTTDPNLVGISDVHSYIDIEKRQGGHAAESPEPPQQALEQSCFSRFVKHMVSGESVPHQNDASASQNNPMADEYSISFLSDLEILTQLQGISTMESSSKGKQPMLETCVNRRYSGIQYSYDLLSNKQTKKSSTSGQAWIQRWHSPASTVQSNVKSNLYVMSSERSQYKARNSIESDWENKNNLPSAKAMALAGIGVEKQQTSRNMGLISGWSYNSMKLFKSKELAEALVI